MFDNFRSLKFRLMVLITIILIFVVCIPVVLFIYRLDRNYEEFSTNMIETTSQVVYQFIYDGMIENDSVAIQENLEFLSMDPSIELIRIYRPSGQILYSSRVSEIKHNIREVSSDFDSFDRENGMLESFNRKDNIYSHHHPIYVQEECLPCHQNTGSLIAVMDVQAGFTPSHQLYVSLKNLAIFGGLIVVVILWILLNLMYQSQIESRLKAIVSGFEKLSQGDFDFTINMPGRHELAWVAQKFNSMIHNLRTARQKEDQFFQEKMQRADRMVTLGEVAAEIAHEVNNPAGIILTRAEFLRDELRERGQESPSLRDLDIIIQQTEKIADTTRTILHYSRKLPQKYSKIDLVELIQHSAKILEPRIKKSKVKMDVLLQDQPAYVWGNFNQLEQVFCNLINNSLDFVKPEVGAIRIELDRVTHNGDRVKYLVDFKDNGPGVPLEYRDKIFSPFFTSKIDGKGTGLGLFIVKNIISNHNGKVTLVDDHESGARFVIEMEAYNGKS